MLAAIPFPPVSPEIFTIEAGGIAFTLRWYALSYVVGILIGWRLCAAALRRPALWSGSPPVPPEKADDLMTVVIFGILIGGRLGYVIFYQPFYYLTHPLEILAVWQGGMSFHGGFLGVAFAMWYFSRRNGAPFGSISDIVVTATPPGIFLGRIANFINAELWGRPTDMPWGVIFPGRAAQNCPGVEGPCARHPSQLYEAGLEGILLGALLLWLAFARGAFRMPWFLTGVFMAGYGTARFFVEFFRQADLQFIEVDNPLGHVIRLGDAGLSMGQLLSLPLLIFGLAIIVMARKRA